MFGRELYDKYLKVVANKDNMERVANMQLYQEKHQYKYLSENDVIFLRGIFRDEFEEEKSIKTAINMLKKNKYTIEEIAEVSELTIEKVKELKEQLDKKS